MCGRVTLSKTSFSKACLEITGKQPTKSNPDGLYGPESLCGLIGSGYRSYELTWGFPIVEDPGRMIYNARIETITTGQYWHFCRNWYVFPIERFYETNSGKFYGSQSGIMLGAIGTEKNFVVITRPAEEDEISIHNRMPYILNNAEEAINWIDGIECMNTINHASFELVSQTNLNK